MIKIDREVEQDQLEIKKLEEGNRQLQEKSSSNEEAGTGLLAEMGAIDQSKTENKRKLDGLKANFNSLKRDI